VDDAETFLGDGCSILGRYPNPERKRVSIDAITSKVAANITTVLLLRVEVEVQDHF